jgi:Ca2+-binding RTX toxin-like protein
MGGPGEEIHGHIGDIFGDPIFFGPDPDDPYVDNYIEPTAGLPAATTTTTVTFSEVVTATTGNDALEGATGNTNFTMAQGTTLGGTDTATDQGGTDGMTFENINNANIKVALVAGGTTVAYAKEGLTYDAGTAIGQVSFTDIENLYVQDSIGGAAQKLSLDMSALTGTGIAVAGTNAGNDTIDLSGESGYLGAQLWGQGGNDTISGGAAGDTIYGGAGGDTIIGGAGEDRLYGGADADTITGGTGADQLYGGTGLDIFIFTNQSEYSAGLVDADHDQIYGFTTGADKLHFTAANFTGITAAGDPAIVLGTGDQAVELIVMAGKTAPSHADQRWIYNPTTGGLYYDADGVAGATIAVAQLLDIAGDPVSTIAAADIVII